MSRKTISTINLSEHTVEDLKDEIRYLRDILNQRGIYFKKTTLAGNKAELKTKVKYLERVARNHGGQRGGENRLKHISHVGKKKIKKFLTGNREEKRKIEEMKIMMKELDTCKSFFSTPEGKKKFENVLATEGIDGAYRFCQSLHLIVKRGGGSCQRLKEYMDECHDGWTEFSRNECKEFKRKYKDKCRSVGGGNYRFSCKAQKNKQSCKSQMTEIGTAGCDWKPSKLRKNGGKCVRNKDGWKQRRGEDVVRLMNQIPGLTQEEAYRLTSSTI